MTWQMERAPNGERYLVDSLGKRVAKFLTDDIQAAYVVRVLQQDRARLDAIDPDVE